MADFRRSSGHRAPSARHGCAGGSDESSGLRGFHDHDPRLYRVPLRRAHEHVEANVSAPQQEPPPHARVSEAHANQRGPRGPEEPPPQGSSPSHRDGLQEVGARSECETSFSAHLPNQKAARVRSRPERWTTRDDRALRLFTLCEKRNGRSGSPRHRRITQDRKRRCPQSCKASRSRGVSKFTRPLLTGDRRRRDRQATPRRVEAFGRGVRVAPRRGRARQAIRRSEERPGKPARK